MGDRYVHLLGYGFKLNDLMLNSLLNDCKGKMQYLNDAVIINMAKDYKIKLEEYEKYMYPPEVGGYKNSNFLLHKGIIKSILEYFPIAEKYGVKINEIDLPQLSDVCETIKNAGGIPVIAHPYGMLDKNNLEKEIYEAINCGIMGVECYYPDHSEEITNLCLDICKKNDLLVTAGSDDHGEFNKVIDGVVYQIGEILKTPENITLLKEI